MIKCKLQSASQRDVFHPVAVELQCTLYAVTLKAFNSVISFSKKRTM